uniref:BEN domain-containing protein n=1 Tax=Glossina brevipalpis TaxID=37001 RepID=A0A1A9WKL3_9MUSC
MDDNSNNKENLVVSSHRAFSSWNPVFCPESPFYVRMRAIEKIHSSLLTTEFPVKQKLDEKLDYLVRKCEGSKSFNYCSSEQSSSSDVLTFPVTPHLGTVKEYFDKINEYQDMNDAKDDSDGYRAIEKIHSSLMMIESFKSINTVNYCSSEQGSSSGVSSLPITTPVVAAKEYFDKVNEYQDINVVKNESDGENSSCDEYPMRTIEDGVEMVIIGNYDTRIPAEFFDAILWNSGASATRQLLGYIFTDDELATHTLTGKPSPAFHGRERPPKSQLNPDKVADVISIVQAKCLCSEREVRGAITTKCSDTARKYQRKSIKKEAVKV